MYGLKVFFLWEFFCLFVCRDFVTGLNFGSTNCEYFGASDGFTKDCMVDCGNVVFM